jgi:hypothetical protein
LVTGEQHAKFVVHDINRFDQAGSGGILTVAGYFNPGQIRFQSLYEEHNLAFRFSSAEINFSYNDNAIDFLVKQ